ncbi:MAG: hypothetical protein ABFD25_22720 [Clostridiaceae bacterium]
MFDAVLKVLSDEIEFYKNKENANWSSEKNKGFKQGLDYCKALVQKMSESQSTNSNISFKEMRVLPKFCYICGKHIDEAKQKSRYYTDYDRPICEECWNEGKDVT